MLNRRIRHINRYREIATVLARNGFGILLEELGLSNFLSLPKRLFKIENLEDPQTIGKSLRNTIEQLGPTYIKIGQIASTRPDIIPDYLITELEKLQDQVKPFPFEEASKIIKEELGFLPHEIYSEFDEKPIATASIGQVYRAVLKSGEEVAVKVQRPDIVDIIETDLEILLSLADLAERRIEWAKHYRANSMVEEFARSLRNELDYSIEARNTEKIARGFEGDSKIRIPKVFFEYSRKRVLTLEFIDGVKLSKILNDENSDIDRKGLGESLIKAMFNQILIEGFFHGDPHPGNIFVLDNQVISFIDFGMVGRLDSNMKYHFASLVIAMMRQKTQDMIDAICDMGIVPEFIDMRLLYKDIEFLHDKYLDQPLGQIQLGEAINELFQVAFKHRIIIPTDFVVLGKSLLTLEGIVEQLDSEISIIDIAKPFGQQLLKERLNPYNLADKAYHNIKDYADLLIDLPKQLKELIFTVRRERIQFEVAIPELENFLRKFDRISNQLSFSILLLAFCILMSSLVIATALGSQPLIFGYISAIDISFVIAFIMFCVLLFSIFRSGRF